jgi:predicted TIM-barrel fold metal-dependent hydrolase
MRIVDTHAHIYSEDTGHYPLKVEPYLPPPGKGTLDHLKQEMRAGGVDRVVMVHTSTAYLWDNRLVADMVAMNRDFATGVCTLDPNDRESPRVLEDYFKTRGIRGLRLYPQPDGKEGATFELPGHLALWEKAAELGVVICALIDPSFLDALRRLMTRFPNVNVVLDHCANLTADDAPDGPRLKQVLALADVPRLHAKLSFLITGSKERYPFRDTHVLGRKVIDAFGAGRCMWGSDFPCELWLKNAGASYADHLRLFTHELGLDQETKGALLGETAMRLWFPEER